LITPDGFVPWDTIGFAADTFMLRLACESAKKIKFQELPEKLCKETGHFPTVQSGRVVTGDQFIAGEVKRQWLEKTFRADCVEMEGAAVAQVCAINHVPFLIIRCLSDLANEKAEVDFPAFVDYAARNSSILVIQILLSLGDN
jgi:5'-methylthioadenosine/S-adenosylhomocysteine nucleosidase